MLDNNLKYCREELEMTQEELGYVFGVSRQTVTGWETNQDPIPLPKLVKFSNMYKYSLDYITGLTRKNDNFKEIGKLDKKQVGASLKDIRLKLGLTQQQLSDECMITQATYSGYENGKYLITSFSLYTICYKHKLSFYDIIK